MRTITGGLAPYTAASSSAANATGTIDGTTLTLAGVAAGSSTVTVTDALGQTDTVTVTVTAGASSEQVQLPPQGQNVVAVLVFASHEDPVAEAIDISDEFNVELRVESRQCLVSPRRRFCIIYCDLFKVCLNPGQVRRRGVCHTCEVFYYRFKQNQ